MQQDEFGKRYERMFAELCGQRFLKPFVFHSPKFWNPTEQEAGDIVLWIRFFVIDFELVTHNAELSNSTRQFVKRIGQKRDQLIRDYDIFKDKSIEIRLQNELAQDVVFDKAALAGFSFFGIVLVDCAIPIDKLHFNTVRKSIDAEFPLAIMTKKGFQDLLAEIDTIPDLIYYLSDRRQFLNAVFEDCPNLFLDLNLPTKKNVISFYKLNENKFELSQWHSENVEQYPELYQKKWNRRIDLRNQENEVSWVIDDITDYIRKAAGDGENAKLHTWELSMLSRRQRATELAHKIKEALINLGKGQGIRWFANYNQATACWLVFYFRFGISLEEFQKEADLLTRRKLLVEITERDFKYSVFSYCFRKSDIETGASFDNIYLGIADADKEKRPIDPNELAKAREWFHGGRLQKLKEFPDA